MPIDQSVPSEPPQRSHTFASPNDLITNDEFENQSMNRVPSAATEPVPKTNDSFLNVDEELDPKKNKPYHRSQTAPGKFNENPRTFTTEKTYSEERSFFLLHSC